MTDATCKNDFNRYHRDVPKGCPYCRIAELEATLKKPCPDCKRMENIVNRTCRWKHGYEYDEETWESECGHTWVFMEGDFKDNSVKFCQGCGGKVVGDG